MKTRVLLSISLAVIFLTSGCAWIDNLISGRQKVKNDPVALYQAGVEAYNRGRYSRAVEYFTRVKERFPLHELALMAEIGLADSYFSDKDYANAELAYTDFLNLHPTHEYIPYVMYQIGMCHYMNMLSIDRDQTATVRAIKEFEQVIARFPTSKFAVMAEEKLRECRKRMAAKEFYVGRFYFRQGQYQAAVKRFEYLLTHYANLGYDYQARVFLEESKRRLAQAKAKSPDKLEGRIIPTPEK
ncbi:MAG: outer membrane protein assembly factor BamD [Syntrophales bacterium]|nr:outer membrane protein assembly factor BamD [Syntrophales bacterium]